jgi:hypothetical protein
MLLTQRICVYRCDLHIKQHLLSCTHEELSLRTGDELCSLIGTNCIVTVCTALRQTVRTGVVGSGHEADHILP